MGFLRSRLAGRLMPVVTGDDFPDVEGAIKDFLKADAGIVSIFSTRVFLGMPRKTGTFPAVGITRVGGGQGPGDSPLDMAIIQFDVYGETADKGGGRQATTTAALAVRKALSSIRGKTRLNESVVAYDVRIASSFFSAMPGDDRPRYIVTAVVPAIALAQ